MDERCLAQTIRQLIMNNIAWHHSPVSASDFFIRVDLSQHGMAGRFEQLWVKKIDSQKFQICCIPFFTYGIALGDIVETDNDFTLLRILTKSGHRTLRVAIVIKEEQEIIHDILHEWVNNTGLEYEWYASGYLAVDIPPDINILSCFSNLEPLEASGVISVEIDG